MSSVAAIRSKLRSGGLLSDAVLTSAVGMGVYFLSAVTGPLLARSLGTASRGDLAAVLVPTQLIGIVLLLGIPHSCAFYARDHGRRPLVMTAWVALAALLPIVLGLGYVLAPHYLDGHDPVTVPWFLAFLVVWMLFLPTASALDTLRGLGEIRRYNALRAAPFVLNFIGVVGLAIAGRLTLRTALGAALVAHLTAWVVTYTATHSWPGRGFDRPVATEQIRFGLRAAVGMLAMTVVTKLDQFLLVPMVDPEVLGLYVVAATGASLTSPLGLGVALALFPHVRSTSAAESDRQTKRALKWTAAASGSIALAVGLMAPFVIPFLFGSDFRGSVVPMIILLPGQVLGDLSNIQTSRLEADGRPGAASQSIMVAAIITVVGLLIAVPRLGIEGAALVTSIAQLGYFVTGYVFLRTRRRAIARS